MASGKLLRQLIKSGTSGDTASFRVASEAVVRDERDKNHHLLANDLERLLYGDQSRKSMKQSGLATPAPSSQDSGLPLLEERPVVREEKDIILAPATQSMLDQLLLEHNRADVLRSYGLHPAQKLLFCGPPGCGKTVTAEVLANELSLPMIVVRLDSVISSFLGETAANLRKVFDYVAQTPTVAVFDEFDALTKDRGDSADHGELKRSVNAVLQMMDGYHGRSILVATTNYESLLDKAIWRRFDETVRFEAPDDEQIQRLLALKLSGVRRNFETDDKTIVESFHGLTHADIERVLRRAIKEMVLAGRKYLETSHLKSALAREYQHAAP